MKETFKPYEEGKMSFNPTVKPVPSSDMTTAHIRYDVNPCTCKLLANNDYANAKIQLSNNNKKQVITSSVIHPNGVFFYSNQEADFWLLLSKSIGWGRFTKVSKEKEFANIFELAEVRSAEKEPPSVINHSSVVLRRLPEALEVLLSIPSSQLQEYLKTR